jgi:TatD DNase family protein
MMYLDAHSHLHLYEDDELESVLDSIEELGILTVSVSLDVESFLKTEEIARQSEWVIPAFGVHPWTAPDVVDAVDSLEAHFDRSPMIGEIGLDHRFVTDEAMYNPQRVVFDWFLTKIVQRNRLASIHCVGAEQETAELIAAHGLGRGIIHWYSGPMDVMQRLIDHGLMFSVGVEVLHSDHVRSLARAIPNEQLLTETDNPGGPREVTGEWGYPSLVVEVIEELARIRDTNPTGIVDIVRGNWAALIQHDKHLQSWLTI